MGLSLNQSIKSELGGGFKKNGSST